MIIKGYRLSDETVMELGRFAILWNHFEGTYCGNNCSVREIKRVYQRLALDEGKQKELATVLNERREYFGQIIPDYVDTGLYPGNARRTGEEDSVLMQKFMEQEEDDVRCGCLLVIHRIRNNLMHGLKCISDLDGQIKLFRAVNGVLESIERKSK